MKLLFFFIAIFFITNLNYNFCQIVMDRAAHLDSNANVFMYDIPTDLNNLSSKFYVDGTFEIKDSSAANKDTILGYLNLDTQTSFALSRIRPSRFNNNVVFKFYEQFYNGVKVSGGGITIKKDTASGKIIHFSPHIYYNLNINTNPTFTQNQLENYFQTEDLQSFKLVITNRFGEFRIVWFCSAIRNNSMKLIWVDAHSGNELDEIDADAGIDAITHTYGTRDLNDNTENGITSMVRPDNSDDNSLRVFENSPNSINPNEWNETLIPTTENTTWGEDANIIARQVFYTADLVIDAFIEEAGIEFGNVRIAASMNFIGARAFFGSTSAECYCQFGLRAVDVPTAVFDITAHELAHCYLNPFLAYDDLSTNQALHEGIADIFGSYIESFMPGPENNERANNTTDWVTGGDEPALANIYNRDQRIRVCLDDMEAQNEGQHQRGRIISHWFFAISTGIIDNDIPEIGMQTAMDILIESLLNLNNENAGFPQMREHTLIITEQRFGVCSPHYQAVVNAWDRVCVEGDSESCPCESLDAPVLISNNLENDCPENFVNLEDFYSGTPPSGAELIFSESFPWNSEFTSIDPYVLEDGIYYAYYYDVAQDCYSFPSEPIHVDFIECCGVTSDVYITENEIFTHPKSFGGNIYVQDGAVLTIHTEIEMGEGKGIYVTDSESGLVLNHHTFIDKCPLASSWKGILIENDASIVTSGGILRSVESGISVLNGDNINIRNIEIYGIGSGIGIYLNDPAVATIINTKIDNFDIGIKGEHGPLTIMELINITNVNIGGFFRAYPVLFYDSEISSQKGGITLHGSHGSIISDNVIKDYSGNGIGTLSSSTIGIVNNIIGSNSSKSGIYQIFSKGSIVNDNSIVASNYGMRFFNSGRLISNNEIEIFGHNKSGGGILVTSSSLLYIYDNYLDVKKSAFAIECNHTLKPRIINNYIKFFSTLATRSSAIRSVGANGAEIESNIIIGVNIPDGIVADNTGILAQNTSFNTFKCNEILNVAEAMGIYHNSPMHTIRSNTFDGSIDLSIRSTVGEHFYQGNEFVGGNTRAIGLDPFELDNSRFYVNSAISNHMPTDPVPGNGQWFDDQPNPNYECCDSSPGPNCNPSPEPHWVPFDNDSIAICEFYQHLKSLDSLKPNKYFLGVFDLLLLSEMNDTFNLPGCVLLDQDFQNLCGLNTLVNVVRSLDTLSIQPSESDSLISYQEQWVEASDSLAKVQLSGMIETEITSLYPDFALALQQDSMDLEAIQTQLNSITCSSGLSGIWRNIYTQYVKFLQNEGQVDSSDQSALRQHSSLCSDVYGKPIHLARAITATFDTIYYEQFDDCIYGMEQRIVRVSPEEEPQIEVYPNPTTGLLQIVLPENYSGELTVMDISGRKVAAYSIKNSEKYSLQMPEERGMYMLRFDSSKGKSEHHRILVIE